MHSSLTVSLLPEVIFGEASSLALLWFVLLISLLTNAAGYIYHNKKTRELIHDYALAVARVNAETFDLPQRNRPYLAEKPMAFLVGAGPGDPELLTVAAVRVLKRVDIVIADVLVPKEILGLCKGRIIYSRKRKGCANEAQAELQAWIVQSLRRGQSVARLKGGDPFVYGRGMEEVEHIVNAGFRVKVISGVSSSFAAPLAAGISITARGVANKVLLATAHGKYDTFPDIPAFVPNQSTLYLMSVSRLGRLVKGLAMKGHPHSLPVAIIEKATLATQRTIKATLQTVEAVAKAERVSSPAVIVVGNVVDQSKINLQSAYCHGGVVFESLHPKTHT